MAGAGKPRVTCPSVRLRWPSPKQIVRCVPGVLLPSTENDQIGKGKFLHFFVWWSWRTENFSFDLHFEFAVEMKSFSIFGIQCAF